MANTHKPLCGHGYCDVYRVGEADLGHGEDEGDEMREDVQAIIVRDTGHREDEAGEDDAEGVWYHQGGDQGFEDWLEIKIRSLYYQQGQDVAWKKKSNFKKPHKIGQKRIEMRSHVHKQGCIFMVLIRVKQHLLQLK